MDGLPLKTREIAEQKFELLKRDPYHPSLHFKKVGKYWSARANIGFRAFAIQDGEDFIWFWIGNHQEYERLMR